MRRILLGMFALVILAGCAQQQMSDMDAMNSDVGDEYYEKIPVVNAYYEGEEIWFIHPDVTDQKVADMLSMMVDGYPVTVAPRHSEVVDIDKLAKFYLFTNGIDHKGEKPWGGGPFFFQIDIFDSVPGDGQYTALRNPSTVTWNDDATPRILKSIEELFAAEAAGEVVIEQTDLIVNVPVVRWQKE